MSYIGTKDFFLEVEKGNVAGHTIINAIGERESMGTTATGEDIWPGVAVVVPIPADAGEQMEVVSDDVNDASAGTGVRTVEVHYLDASGNEQTETVTMNGTTGVALIATNVRFVQHIHTLTVGSNGAAVGLITIYKQGATTTIYNQIDIGGNMSLVPHRMVPLNKTLYFMGWNGTEAQAKRVSLRVRSTDEGGTLLPGIFLFKDLTYLKQTASGQMEPTIKMPALSITKVTGWASVAGAEASCSWWGVLVDD